MDKLELDLRKLEGELGQESDGYPSTDVQRISSDLTRAQTSIVTKRTKAESHLATLQRILHERARHLRDLEQIQELLQDLQRWILEAQDLVSRDAESLSRKEIYSLLQQYEVEHL